MASSVRTRLPVRPPRPPAPPAGPPAVLRPERADVPFRGRTAELAALTEWTRAGPVVSVGLLTGDAGAGKTRPAQQLCRPLAEVGWAAGLVDDSWDVDRPARLDQLGRLAEIRVDL